MWGNKVEGKELKSGNKEGAAQNTELQRRFGGKGGRAGTLGTGLG